MTIYRRRRFSWIALLALVAGVALAFILRGSGGAQAIDASVFSSGACVAYPPTSGNRSETVFLDAGHGGIDRGAGRGRGRRRQPSPATTPTARSRPRTYGWRGSSKTTCSPR
jgi:hypothetical protein